MVLVVHQGTLGLQLTGQGALLVDRHALRTLTASAAQEVRAALTARVNQLGDPLSRTLRAEVVGADTGARSLSGELDAPVARSMAGRPPYGSCTLGAIDVEVVEQRPLDDAPYERAATLRITVRAQAEGRASPLRWIHTEELGLRVALTGVPRPFDQFGLFVGDTGRLLDLPRLADVRVRLFEEMGRLTASLRAAVPPAGIPADLVAARDDLVARVLDRPTLEQRLPPFPHGEGAMVVGLWFAGQTLAPGRLHLSRQLDAAVALHGQSHQDLVDALTRASSGPDAYREMLAAAERLLAVGDDLLLDLWGFQNGLKVLDPRSPEGSDLARYRGRLGFRHHLRRATHILVPDAQGDVMPALEGLRRRHGPLHGIVVVRGPARPLKLTGAWPGRWVLAGEGVDIVLDSVRSGPGVDDALTVAAFGGQVTLEGDNELALVTGGMEAHSGHPARDATLLMKTGSRLRGGLFLDRLSDEARLDGEIIRSERHHATVSPAPLGSSGVDPAALWVMVGPQARWTRSGPE